MSTIDQAENAVAFMEDKTHEQHLDQLLWMLRTRRDEAASRVPEWDQLRDLASQIKEHTLSNLAHYLEMFESRAKANVVTVHWAQDAHEHNQIVYQLLSDRNVNELIKSKSMLTEECDTRRFLEGRGVRVSETDLGERIQQLDDQPPSHIVGPAWHKTTQDIANVFAKAYGSDKEKADPVYLAHVMRENTRPLIERARAGMTGANFAVAETGAIVTVTNEGNADLSGNVPELRICSVGLEKIIPRNELGRYWGNHCPSGSGCDDAYCHILAARTEACVSHKSLEIPKQFDWVRGNYSFPAIGDQVLDPCDSDMSASLAP